ncbi:MAG: hypothetical protein IKT46_05990 [Clostridia bacterium]|nr:hypothetical protein [Clostridia bacterium]
MKLKEKLTKFFYGRYGMDELGISLLWTSLVLSIINIFLNNIFIWIPEIALVAWCVFRILSKNIFKRQMENRAYNSILGRVRGYFKLQKNKLRDRKTHIYRICPSCHSNLRLPKRKGEHTVKCPRCGNRFDIKC